MTLFVMIVSMFLILFFLLNNLLYAQQVDNYNSNEPMACLVSSSSYPLLRSSASVSRSVSLSNLAENYRDLLLGSKPQCRGYWGSFINNLDGSLVNGSKLPLKGKGFVFKGGHHNYGSRELVTLIQLLGIEFQEEYGANRELYVGDLSAKRGGQLEPHGGHRNGLEVDVYFPYCHKEGKGVACDPWEKITEEQVMEVLKLAKSAQEVAGVINHIGVSGNKRRFVGSQPLQIIFIGQKILKRICEIVRDQGEELRYESTLNFLAVADHHDTHLHVRLGCPVTSPGCKTSPPLPPSRRGCRAVHVRF